MEKLFEEFFDFEEGLDFMTKYGLVISNFVIIFFLLAYKKLTKKQIPDQEQKHILFITAHPDDEAMFFMPVIKESAKDYKMHLLCLSNGNYDKIGKIREQELKECTDYLQFHNLEIVDDNQLQDGPDKRWSSEYVSDVITKYLEKNKDIAGIITFDNYGVSGHTNHIDVFKGVEAHKKSNQDNGLKYYKLESVNIFRKYIGILDFFFTVIFSSGQIFINLNPLSAWKSMQFHGSQFVWYRRLFVIFSRYAYINNIVLMK